MLDFNQSPAFLYTTGGMMKKDAPTYVKRYADELLYQNLRRGNFCYVLAARQMGKSSLRIRISEKLSTEGYTCIGIDLSSFGQHSFNSEQWYYSICYGISRKCGLNIDMLDYTKKQIKHTPVARFMFFLKEVLLPNVKGNIVIFFDEIDYVFSSDSFLMSSDDFFASIRSLYNERSENADLERLNIVLLGVTTPNDLIKDPLRTPFNIGASIPVGNFKFDEAKEPLMIGFKDVVTDHYLLLAEIFYWTNGHPAMTQKLCMSIATKESVIEDIPKVVEQHVYHVFLKPQDDKSEDNTLVHISKRMIKGPFCVEMLWLYYRILSGENISVDNTQMDQLHIKLSGLVVNENNFLVVSNRVFLLAFNKAWVVKQLEQHDRPLAPEIDFWVMSDRKKLMPTSPSQIIQTLYILEHSGQLNEIELAYQKAVDESITSFWLKVQINAIHFREWIKELVTSLPALFNKRDFQS